MTPLFFRFLRLSTAVLMVVLFSGLPQAFAQEHIVSSPAIQQELINSAAKHDQDTKALSEFFGSESAQKALKNAGISSEQVKNAVSQLSDDELAQLAAKANKAQRDFAAGSLTNQQLTYIIIALATAVIILIIVVA
jgi:uncharacterized DUF497 family protein